MQLRQLGIPTPAAPPSLPWSHALKDGPTDPSGTPEGQGDPAPTSEADRVLVCALCAHPLTSESQQISVDGAHEHTFVNPAMVVYDVRCFREVPGARAHGSFSAYWSWFAGYQWQLVACGHCTTHLGWRYVGTTESFYGLVGGRLRESS